MRQCQIERFNNNFKSSSDNYKFYFSAHTHWAVGLGLRSPRPDRTKKKKKTLRFIRVPIVRRLREMRHPPPVTVSVLLRFSAKQYNDSSDFHLRLTPPDERTLGLAAANPWSLAKHNSVDDSTLRAYFCSLLRTGIVVQTHRHCHVMAAYLPPHYRLNQKATNILLADIYRKYAFLLTVDFRKKIYFYYYYYLVSAFFIYNYW